MTNANAQIKALRTALITEFGSRNYRITSANEVHAYGTMPNSIVEGWWFVGSVKDAQNRFNVA